MGWWDDSIMGGDEPLDDFGDICSIALRKTDKKYVGGNPEVLTRELLDKALPEIRRHIEKETRKDSYGKSVYYQTLGVTIMERGGKMPNDLRLKIVKAAEKDPWMKEEGQGSSRGKKVLAFIEKVKRYTPGKAVSCDEEHGRGLLDKIGEALGG